MMEIGLKVVREIRRNACLSLFLLVPISFSINLCQERYIYIYVARKKERRCTREDSNFWFDSAAVSRPFLLHELPYARRADSALNRERQKIYQAFNENGGIHRGWNF